MKPGILFIFALYLSTLIGCAHYQPGVISLQDIDCAKCGFMVTQELQDNPTVKEPSFDKTNAEVHFQYDAKSTSPEKIVESLKWTNYNLVSGAGQGSYQTMRKFKQAIDVKAITQPGEMVDIYQHLVPGKFTVIDFFATWCGPCRAADEFFAELLTQRDDIALRKIDIIDWDSDVAKHYLKGATEIPHMIVFDADGKELIRLSGYKKSKLCINYIQN